MRDVIHLSALIDLVHPASFFRVHVFMPGGSKILYYFSLLLPLPHCRICVILVYISVAQFTGLIKQYTFFLNRIRETYCIFHRLIIIYFTKQRCACDRLY